MDKEALASAIALNKQLQASGVTTEEKHTPVANASANTDATTIQQREITKDKPIYDPKLPKLKPNIQQKGKSRSL